MTLTTEGINEFESWCRQESLTNEWQSLAISICAAARAYVLGQAMKDTGMYGGTPLDRIRAISEFAEEVMGHFPYSSEPPELKVMAAARAWVEHETGGGLTADEMMGVGKYDPEPYPATPPPDTGEMLDDPDWFNADGTARLHRPSPDTESIPCDRTPSCQCKRCRQRIFGNEMPEDDQGVGVNKLIERLRCDHAEYPTLRKLMDEAADALSQLDIENDAGTEALNRAMAELIKQDNELISLRAQCDSLSSLLHSADEECERLENEVERCHNRLEINLEWRFSGQGPDLECVEIPMEQRAKAIDGIEARDCTIKLQDGKIDALRTTCERYAGLYMERCEKWSALRAEAGRLREALQVIERDSEEQWAIDRASAALGDGE